MKEMNAKEYCYNCNDYVDYVVKKVKVKVQVRNEDVEAEVFECRCKICNEEISVEEYERLNDIAVFDAYKKKVGLLTSQQIKEIRKRREMSQVELAMFLGIGEKDIARYESGSIQNRSIDNMIRLVDDDLAYKRMLIINKPKRQLL